MVIEMLLKYRHSSEFLVNGVIVLCLMSRTITCSNFYGLLVTFMYFLKFESLAGVGDIPYGFVHFEQGCLVLWDTSVKWLQLTDHLFKTYLKSDSEYFNSAQTCNTQSMYPSLHAL